MEPTSEQELKQLLDEGRIRQTEYEQLLAAMHSKRCLNGAENRSGGSRKKYKFLATLSMIAVLCFVAAVVITLLNGKPVLAVINGVAAVLMGANASRYWIRCWSYE